MDNTLESFVDMLHENSNADSVVTENGNTIILVKRVEESISSQVKEPGDGSIFAKAWKLEELKSSLSKLEPKETGLYEGKLSGAGFDLIAERKEIAPLKKLVGYSEGKKLDEATTKKVANVPQHIEKFKTNTITYTLRSVSIDEAIKDFTEFEDDARASKLFILENVEIGPHLDKWSDDLYIVVPQS